jgi:WD40 repeat protein
MVWDIENGRETWIKTPGNVLSLALSPDGHTVACGRESGIEFYRFDTGEKIKTFTLPQTNVTALAFSPDGKRIVLGSDNNADALYSVHFKVLDFETGIVRHSLFTPVDYSNFAACAPDGKHPYTRASGNIMKVWNTATGRELTRITGGWRDIRYAGLSPDGKYLAGALSDSDLIKIWDTASGSEVRTISTGLPDGVESLHFRCGGNKIAALTNGGLHIFDIETGLCISSIPEHIVYRRQPAFNSSDDRYFGVLCRSENSESKDQDLISIFDIETTSETVTFPLPEHKGITAALYYAPGIILAAYYNWDHSQPKEKECTITVYDAASREIRYTDSVPDLDNDAVSFSPSGDSLVMGCGRDLRIVSLKERGDAGIMPIPANHQGMITHVTCLLDMVISASYDAINITDSKTGTLLRTIEAGTDLCLLPASADERFLATASNCLVQVWDVEKKTRERALPVCKYPETVACIPDGKGLLFADDYDKAIYRYDTITGKTKYAFPVSEGSLSIEGFCFRPGMDELIIHGLTYTKAAKAYNFKTGKETLTIQAKNDITCTVYDHKGNIVVCGGGDCYTSFIRRNRKIFIFDAVTGAEIKRFPRSRDDICTIAISHNGRHLVTGSAHHKIVLWDLEKTAIIRTYTGHKDNINIVAFIHDGKRIVSSAEDTTMRIWDRESAACLAVFPGIKKVIPESVSGPAWRYIAALTVHGTVKLFSKDTLEEAIHLISSRDGTFVFA